MNTAVLKIQMTGDDLLALQKSVNRLVDEVGVKSHQVAELVFEGTQVMARNKDTG